MIHNLSNYFKSTTLSSGKGLHQLSNSDLPKMINHYNIYFFAYTDELDTTIQDMVIFKLNNTLDLEKQLSNINSSHFPYRTITIYYTDYKENADIFKMKLHNLKIELENKKQSLTFSNLKRLSKIRDDEVIKKFIYELNNPNQIQKSLFDTVTYKGYARLSESEAIEKRELDVY